MTAMKTGGREARTDYRVVEAHDRASLLELRLYTGRTHQIRVHAATVGYPVIGDATYGRSVEWLKEAKVHRQLLHAWKLTVTHPKSGKIMEFAAPLPQDFKVFKRFLHES